MAQNGIANQRRDVQPDILRLGRFEINPPHHGLGQRNIADGRT